MPGVVGCFFVFFFFVFMDSLSVSSLSGGSARPVRRVSGLWVGESLPLLAQLCIRSYLDHGVEFQLFTYREYDGVPEGTLVRDARAILPQEAVFYHENGSLAPFADWFRNEFLVREGGYWTDLDVACLSDAMPQEEVWFCEQEPGLVAVGVLAFPPHHPVMEALRVVAEDPAAPAPWDSAEELRAKEALRWAVASVVERRRRAPWGHCGPEGFTRALRHFGLLDQAAPPSRLYPLHYTVWRKCYNGDCGLSSPELANAWAIHLWGEMLRHEPDAWENVARGSVVGQLLDRHVPGHVVPEPLGPGGRPSVRILVGVCSCVAAAKRRQACRDTWMSHACRGIDCRFFLGRREPMADEPDVVTLWVEDDYGHLPAKGLAFYAWALEHYDFEWLFKCDDDTYVELSRLGSLCSPDVDLVGDVSLAQRGCPSGGAGYLMSRALVEQLVAHGAEVARTGPEDIVFGELAVRLGARTRATPLLCLGQSPAPQPDNQQVSCHWCPPTLLRDIDVVLHAVPVGVMRGVHAFWQDELMFYRNGRFLRRSSGCRGTYLLCGEQAMVLQWDRWPEDVLARSPGGCYRNESLSLSPVPGKSSLFAVLTGADGDGVQSPVC